MYNPTGLFSIDNVSRVKTRKPIHEVESAKEIRNEIIKIKNNDIQMGFKFQAVTACRVSELCGKYAVSFSDMGYNSYNEHPILIFQIHTAKRNGRVRLVAIPLEEKYEPYAREIESYFLKNKEHKKIFGFARRTFQSYGKIYLGDIGYQVEDYTTKKTGFVALHEKGFTTHGMRHMRLTELMNDYGFDLLDLTIFAGWKFSHTKEIGASAMADRYLYSQWGRYIPKLFKPYMF